ncbi:MAG: protein kinase [Candidatus Marinimicrobia bacterium]|nr:protein kinase [Candidatus Neomarinimicrobiota bacterium]MCF7829025.1 protein kinase [Candidatus Neomarinimicrobiota bacterium]MCF7881838.1 protein kinase [Candidatus Neomarinimicrobiota bacterium]
MDIRILSCVFFLFAFATSAVAANIPNVQFSHLSIEDGLSQNSVVAMLQDQNGFMWYGTEDGLNRYDGYQFTIFKNEPGDSTSLHNNFITTLTQDSSGQIWIGTLRGVCRYNLSEGKFYRYDHFTTIRNNYINSLFTDRDGRVWVATSDSGFGYIDPKTDTYQSYQAADSEDGGLLHNNVYEVWQDHTGDFWIGSQLGFQRFDPGSESYSEMQRTEGSVRAFSRDAGDLWVATYGSGLARYDLREKSMRYYRHSAEDPSTIGANNLMDMLSGPDGHLWIATIEGGLNIFDPTTELFIRYKNDSEVRRSISGNFVESVYQDNVGRIWVGNNADGINIYDPLEQKFTAYHANPDDPHGLSDGMIYAIYEDPDKAGESVWIGTDKGGLNYLNRNTGRFTVFQHDSNDPNSLLHNSVRKIHKDDNGLLWVGTTYGMVVYDEVDQSFGFFHEKKEFFNGLNIRTVLDDPLQPQRYLWIGVTGEGLYRFDRLMDTHVYYSTNPSDSVRLSSTQIRATYGDASGIIWIGSLGGGLDKLNPQTGDVTHYLNDPEDSTSIGSNIVLSIYEDTTVTPQVLWLGTANGIERFDVRNETFTHITEDDGLPNNVVYAVLGDAQGDLWASTNKGITEFNPDSVTFRNFDVKDGLQSNEFNAGAYYKSPTGEMFFGGINGFNLFHPDSIRDNPVIPPVYVTSFRKFDQEVEFEKSLFLMDEIQLDYDEDFFSFEFASLNYTAPEKNQYAYKMEGFDRDWIYCGTRRYASYTNLDPGKYTFRVKASNNDGVWNEAGTSIVIDIAPPPWKSWWAYTLYVIALGLTATGTRWVYHNRRSILALRKRKISHYRLLEIIGQGGMGEVFRALDLNSKEEVALKLLGPELLEDQENRDRFIREGQTMRSFTHRHIVKTYEFGEADDQGYIAMEYLTGGTLEEFLHAEFPFSNTEFRRLVLQICDGLEEIHTQGIIHRDIKTANIMLDAGKDVRIMDFGLSRSPLVATMTSLGTAMGTLGYVAPEQVTNMNVDHRTDIFSLGVVLYELLTNELPFSGRNEMALIHSIFNTIPPPPSSIRPEISPEMDTVVERCLAKEAENRYHSVSELKDVFSQRFRPI